MKHTIALLLSATSLVLATPASSAAFNPVPLTGVNLSGAEFNGGALPGRPFFDYTYPNQAEVTYYVGKGVNVFRVPFLWERIQPTLNGPLDPGELARLQATVAMIKYSGATVVLDVHDFGNYRGQPIGSAAVPITAFVNLWNQLANQWPSDKQVVFGLMNEPASQNVAGWRATVNAVIPAIRAANANNLILIPGAGWDGAHDWTAANAAGFTGIQDPANNFAIEMHEYLDGNFSGTGTTCMSPNDVVNNLTAATAWLRANHYRAFVGEFGASVDPNCLSGLTAMLTYYSTNNDVWMGWTYWAGGPWWGNYFQTIEPVNGQDRPQMTTIRPFLQK